MDISLNISSKIPYQLKPQKEVIPTKVLNKTKKKNTQPNGFSFEFTTNDKIKAVVARRRAPVIIKDKEIPKKQFKIIPQTKIKKPPPIQRNFVMRPPDSDSDDGNNHSINEQTNDIEMNLVLNVTNDASIVPKVKKVQLSRDERSRLKRNERDAGQKGEKIDRVLTQDEINEGIKKFSQVPNKSKPKSTMERKQNSVNRVNLFRNNPETKIIGQRLVKPIREKVFTGNNLNTLDLHPHCVKNLADILNIKELTTVQQKTIPHALAGKDLLVRSQTGSGKTLAYALPMVEKLQKIHPKIIRTTGILAVIIVPTRELAIQTYELLIKLLKPFQWIVPGFLTGGEKRKAEKARLRKGINILVGTPGRLVDHLLHTETFKLDKSQMLILDEADRLLEMGYERDVKQIVEAILDHRQGIFKLAENENYNENIESSKIIKPFVKTNVELQTMLLSATLTPAVQKLAGLTLKEPLFIDNSDEDLVIAIKPVEQYEEAVQEAVNEGKLVIPENLNLSYVLVPPKLRLVTLSGLLAKEKKQLKAMIFMATTEMVNFHHDLLIETLTQKVLDYEDEQNDSDDDEKLLLSGIRFFKLHGAMTQQERSGVFRAFRDAKTGVLLATDVAGRGIDVPEVDLVVQYSPPQRVCDFVHRVGRTARAGRSGRAVLFLGPGETEFVRILEDKRIRISQILMEEYLKALKLYDHEAFSTQEAASNLQHKFEELIKEDKEMEEKASKAYVSWLRNYSTFPKDMKPIFNIKAAHMGHFVKSFGLRDAPNKFVSKHSEPKAQLPTNRLTYTARDQPIKKDNKKAEKRTLGTKVGFSGNRIGGRGAGGGGGGGGGSGGGGAAAAQNDGSEFNKLNRFSQTSMALLTSEFGSGIPAKKKKK